MRKNKKIRMFIITMILGCALIVGCTAAYGASLQIAENENQIAQVNQYKEKMTKLEKTKYYSWKKYLSKAQKQKFKVYQQKIIKSTTKAQIRRYNKKINMLVKKAKQVKKYRKKYIKEVNAYMKNYSDILSSEQLASLKQLRKDINLSVKASVMKKKTVKAFQIIKKALNIPDNIFKKSWSVDKQIFVSVWGRKNNTYLAGTPMAETGWYIAREAYDYNIDPAALAAISTIESGCGVACCGAYNAYGWIWPYAMNFSSWEDGIHQWHAYFSQWFAGDLPLSSMHGYGGYGISSIQSYLSQIRNA